MGFYGKVINYIAKGFSKFKIGNKNIEATEANSEVEFIGKDGVTLDIEDGKVSVSGVELQEAVAAEAKTREDADKALQEAISNFSMTAEYNEDTGILTLPFTLKQ